MVRVLIRFAGVRLFAATAAFALIVAACGGASDAPEVAAQSTTTTTTNASAPATETPTTTTSTTAAPGGGTEPPATTEAPGDTDDPPGIGIDNPACDQWGYIQGFSEPLGIEALGGFPAGTAGLAFDCLGLPTLTNIIDVSGNFDAGYEEFRSETVSTGGGASVTGTGTIEVGSSTYGVQYTGDIIVAVSEGAGNWEPVPEDFFQIPDCRGALGSLGELNQCALEGLEDRQEVPPAMGVIFEVALYSAGAIASPIVFAPLATPGAMEDVNGFPTQRWDIAPEAVELYAESLGATIDASNASASFWVHPSGFIVKMELRAPAFLFGEIGPDVSINYEWAQ